MHGKIIQLSQGPIEKDDYKTSDDYLDTGFMQIADYTYDMNGTAREECIRQIAKDLGSGIEIKDGIFEIKDKKEFVTFSAMNCRAW